MSVERSRDGRGLDALAGAKTAASDPAHFALKRDADAFDRDVKRRRQLGPLAVQQLTARGGPTVGQWIVERWAPEHASTLAQSTRERYANIYAVHLAPWLDDVPLGEITVALLRGWQAELDQGWGEPRNDPQGAYAALERPTPRCRERGDPREPALPRRPAEDRP